MEEPVSFGQGHSMVIRMALMRSMAQGETELQFVQRVLEGLRRTGFNPEAPHSLLPPP